MVEIVVGTRSVDPDMVLIEDRLGADGGQRWHALGLAASVQLLVVVHVSPERQKMAKKSSPSFRRERLVSVRAEDIFNKPLTQAQRRALERLKAMPESEIDYSDIPPLKAGTPEVFVGTAADEALPNFSPDDRWIAYRSAKRDATPAYGMVHGIT
jgi:hypothetical protein